MSCTCDARLCSLVRVLHVQGHEEPLGSAKATRAYNLPSKYVLHTVGPTVPQPRSRQGGALSKPTQEQEEQLCSCYRSCLDLAARLPGPVRSVAFCCVSTGLFGFPQARAAELAIDTVSAWLRDHDHRVGRGGTGSSSIELVVFNVFKPEDENHYAQHLGRLLHLNATPTLPRAPVSTASLRSISATELTGLSLAKEWLRHADAVLIAGGAGLSAAAGLDYNSEAVFRRHFPAMHRRGFRCFYEFIGFRDWTPALQWGYLLSQVNLARFHWPKSSVYAKLRALARGVERRSESFAEQKEEVRHNTDDSGVTTVGDSAVESAEKQTAAASFVLTTNADGMFGQNDFPLERVFTAQGDYSRMQCLKPCSPEAVWPIKEFIDAALPYIDAQSQEITEPRVIPKCKRCQGPVMMNVRGGDWFLEGPHAAQRRAYQRWLAARLRQAKERGKLLVLLEIGVGFNTPSVIRFPMQELASTYDSVCKLIRINVARPEVPEDLEDQSAVGLSMEAEEAIDALLPSVALP